MQAEYDLWQIRNKRRPKIQPLAEEGGQGADDQPDAFHSLHDRALKPRLEGHGVAVGVCFSAAVMS